MNNSKDINKIYRYEALLQAIDFFTQRFTLEQLTTNSFEFTNEILTIHSSALFIRFEDKFIQQSKRLYHIENQVIDNTESLNSFPLFHGDIVTERFERFIPKEIIEKFNIKLFIPLIIYDYLHGFIISNGKTMGDLDNEDKIIASTLAKLFRNSFENSRQIDELNQKTKLLDQKIFNLFTINQSAKSLLYQVNLDELYSIATDVFSEITSSKITSFGIYDISSNSIKLLGYKDVSTFSQVFTEFKLLERKYNSNKVIFELEKDKEQLMTIFENWEDFKLIQAKYIILLVKEEILGVVTLSESVNDRLYDNDTFELIEALASFAHIAISNALLFKKINDQKIIIEKKFEVLYKLNQIIRIINKSNDIDEISTLTLKVLSINFGVNKAFMAYNIDDHNYRIDYSIGLDNIEKDELIFNLNSKWGNIIHGDLLVDFQKDAIHNYFDKKILSRIGESNCIVISPLYLYNPDILGTSLPLGLLIVVETKDGLKEEDVLLVDTISRNITPIIYKMNEKEKLLIQYKQDNLDNFLQAVNHKLKERIDYEIDFNIYYKTFNQSPFSDVEYPDYQGEYYLVNNYMFLITYDELDSSEFISLPYFESIEDILEMNI